MREMDVVGVRVEMPSNQPIVLLREVSGITLVVGLPEYSGGSIYNAAYVIRDGGIVAVASLLVVTACGTAESAPAAVAAGPAQAALYRPFRTAFNPDVRVSSTTTRAFCLSSALTRCQGAASVEVITEASSAPGGRHAELAGRCRAAGPRAGAAGR